MLSLLVKLFAAINSENSTRQVALALALGAVAGLAPLLTLHNLLLVLLVFLLRVHLGAFFLSLFFFKGLAVMLSGVIVNVGEAALTAESLTPLFDFLYQFSLFKLLHWHHTYTLGAVIVGAVLLVPLYFIFRILIEKYREHVKQFFEKFKIIKALKASKFYRLYLQVSGS